MTGTTAVVANMDVRRFAREQATHRLARVAFEVRNTLQIAPSSSATVEAVHDLRVSTRRFRAVLDTFEEFFPPEERKRITKELRSIFRLAGNVRNLDITQELLRETGMEGVEPAQESMQAERSEAMLRLIEALRVWVRQDFSFRWREGLNLP